ncbi:uncharacterized protein [Argopecten irradians]|uniref:uncharacterized protein n=1 Tax=Argopecten irradians TaxID=31199 RepID=UPI0037243308
MNGDEKKVVKLLKRSDADLSQILDFVVDNRDIRMLNVMVTGGLELNQFPDNVVIRILRSCDKRMIEVLKEGRLELKQLPDNVLMEILRTSNERIIQSLKECGYELNQVSSVCTISIGIGVSYLESEYAFIIFLNKYSSVCKLTILSNMKLTYLALLNMVNR